MAQMRWAGGTIKWGILFGLVLGLSSVLRTTSLVFLPGVRLVGVLRGSEIRLDLIALAAYFLAGLLAGRQAGSVESGAHAGLITAVVGYAICAVAGVVAMLIAPRAFAMATGIGFWIAGIESPALLFRLIVSLIVNLLIYAFVGAAVGALGGMVGRASRPHARQPHQHVPDANPSVPHAHPPVSEQ